MHLLDAFGDLVESVATEVFREVLVAPHTYFSHAALIHQFKDDEHSGTPILLHIMVQVNAFDQLIAHEVCVKAGLIDDHFHIGLLHIFNLL